MAVIPLYAATIHQTAANGDLNEMKALVEQAEKWLSEHGNVANALEVLKQEIAKAESGKY